MSNTNISRKIPSKVADKMARMTASEMAKAYQHLYEIEVRIRYLISSKCHMSYGSGWNTNESNRIDLQNATYFELVNYFNRNSALSSVFSKSEISQLYSLRKTRNKICHCHPLNHSELNSLKICRNIVFKSENLNDKPINQYSHFN